MTMVDCGYCHWFFHGDAAAVIVGAAVVVVGAAMVIVGAAVQQVSCGQLYGSTCQALQAPQCSVVSLHM